MSNAAYLASLVNSSGNINIPVSNAGINFANTTSGVLTEATLNDYETGTWTPTQGAGLTVVGTFTSAGTYTKVGNTVYITGRVTSTTSITCSAGAVISSLPFSCLSTSPGISLVGRLCNNSGAFDAATYVTGTTISPLSAAVASTSNIFFTAVYQATF